MQSSLHSLLLATPRKPAVFRPLTQGAIAASDLFRGSLRNLWINRHFNFVTHPIVCQAPVLNSVGWSTCGFLLLTFGANSAPDLFIGSLVPIVHLSGPLDTGLGTTLWICGVHLIACELALRGHAASSHADPANLARAPGYRRSITRSLLPIVAAPGVISTTPMTFAPGARGAPDDRLATVFIGRLSCACSPVYC